MVAADSFQANEDGLFEVLLTAEGLLGNDTDVDAGDQAGLLISAVNFDPGAVGDAITLDSGATPVLDSVTENRKPKT